MPANPSSPESPRATEAESDEAQPDPAQPEIHMSRAERRAAARGKTLPTESHLHHGKVVGARGPQATRRQYSNRRSGG